MRGSTLTRGNWLCLFALMSVIVAVFVVGNLLPRRHEGDPENLRYGGSARVEYGFPFTFRTDWVVKWSPRYGPRSDGTPMESWPDRVYSTKFDDQALKSNVGIGLAILFLTSMGWILLCRAENRRYNMTSLE